LGDGKFSAPPDAFAETKVILDINDYVDKPSFWTTAHAAAAVSQGLVPVRLQSKYTPATTSTSQKWQALA